MLRLCEFVFDRVVESLQAVSPEVSAFNALEHTGPVMVEFDLLLHVPTKSAGIGTESAACAVASPALTRPNTRAAEKDTMAMCVGQNECRGWEARCAYRCRGKSYVFVVVKECGVQSSLKPLPSLSRRLGMEEGAAADRGTVRLVADLAGATPTSRASCAAFPPTRASQQDVTAILDLSLLSEFYTSIWPAAA